MTSSGFVSVLLPVFNAGRYLEQAVRSVLDQTHTTFEFVIIDDGSTDGSSEFLARMASMDKRIRLISQENRGLIKTLNRSIEESTGDLVFRMDADDVCERDRFERQVQYLDHHPECVAVGMHVQIVDPFDRCLRVMTPPLDHEGIDSMGLDGVGAAIFHPSVCIRRDALLKVGGYHEDYPHAEDVDLFLRLAEVGQLANLPDVGLRYRVHPSSIGYSQRAKQIQSARKAASDAYVRRGLPSSEWATSANVDRNVYQTHLMWAWWALGDGHVNTARHYAWKALCHKPFDGRSWKLIASALRGH